MSKCPIVHFGPFLFMGPLQEMVQFQYWGCPYALQMGVWRIEIFSYF